LDDAHVHASLASVVQESRMEGTADRLITTEAKGNVGHACVVWRKF